MIDLLQKLGFTANQAKVLKVLFDEQWHTQREIEREADLCQPLVSLALKSLDGYIEIGSVEREGKGAPLKPVRLKDGFLDNIEYEQYVQYDAKVGVICELRSYVPSLHEKHDNSTNDNA